MSQPVRAKPSQHVMKLIGNAQKNANNGAPFWMARELQPLLGYDTWSNFKNAIERARMSCEVNGRNAKNHFVETGKMVGIGSGAMRKQEDYFLSKYACHLIAMNGDPSKVEIASAQAYFVVQTHKMDAIERSGGDHHRLTMRHRVSDEIKRLGAVAKDVGVKRFPFLNAARLHGFYGQKTVAEVKRVKGVPAGEEVLDVINSWELALHEAQIGMARQKILDEGITGEQPVIDTQRKIAESFRETVKDNLGYGPEHIPCEEPIKAVEKRLKEEARPKRISGPTS